MWKSNFEILFALMDEDSVLYTVASYHGHLCRVYPDGKIAPVDEADTTAASFFKS